MCDVICNLPIAAIQNRQQTVDKSAAYFLKHLLVKKEATLKTKYRDALPCNIGMISSIIIENIVFF